MGLLACNMGQLDNVIAVAMGCMFGPPVLLLLGVIWMRTPPAA